MDIQSIVGSLRLKNTQVYEPSIVGVLHQLGCGYRT